MSATKAHVSPASATRPPSTRPPKLAGGVIAAHAITSLPPRPSSPRRPYEVPLAHQSRTSTALRAPATRDSTRAITPPTQKSQFQQLRRPVLIPYVEVERLSTHTCTWLGCRHYFRQRSELASHVQEKHLSSVIGLEVFPCGWNTCGELRLSRHDLLQHIRADHLKYKTPTARTGASDDVDVEQDANIQVSIRNKEISFRASEWCSPAFDPYPVR
jgi:hypothetical protein